MLVADLLLAPGLERHEVEVLQGLLTPSAHRGAPGAEVLELRQRAADVCGRGTEDVTLPAGVDAVEEVIDNVGT